MLLFRLLMARYDFRERRFVLLVTRQYQAERIFLGRHLDRAASDHFVDVLESAARASITRPKDVGDPRPVLTAKDRKFAAPGPNGRSTAKLSSISLGSRSCLAASSRAL